MAKTARKSPAELQIEKCLKLAAGAAEAEITRLARERLAEDPTLVCFKMNMGREWFEHQDGTTNDCHDDDPIVQFIIKWDRVLDIGFWSMVVTRNVSKKD
jgi:hypothetical protein